MGNRRPRLWRSAATELRALSSRSPEQMKEVTRAVSDFLREGGGNRMPTGPDLERVVKVGVEDADTAHRARFAASRRAATAMQNLIEVLHRRALTDDDYNRVAEEVDV